MSKRHAPDPRPDHARHRRAAAIFAALGDPTRLTLLARLGAGEPLSISRLSDSSPLTRQAVTKHLTTLRRAGLVRARRRGRESHYQLQPNALSDALQSLNAIAAHWEDALARLKAHVER